MTSGVESNIKIEVQLITGPYLLNLSKEDFEKLCERLKDLKSSLM
jgi:hypothetical protein